MEYVIKELKDNVTDNYLKDIITIKGISIDKKLEMIKTYMNDVITSKLELERILYTTKSIMIKVNSVNEEFTLILDNDSITVYSFEDLGALIKKVNNDVDYSDIIHYLIPFSNNTCSEFDIKLVKCLNTNTTNDRLKRVTSAWLECSEESPKVERLGEYVVVTGAEISYEKLLLDSYKSTDERIKQMGIEVMDKIFMDENADMELRLKAGKIILDNVLGKKEI